MSNIDTSNWLLLIFLAVSAMWDFCLNKIPNSLIVITALLIFGLSPSIAFIIRAMSIVLLLSPFQKNKMIGGGDVKLLALMCAVLGVKPFLRCFICISFIAGMSSLLKIASDKSIFSRLTDLKNYTVTTFSTKRVFDFKQKKRLVIPFATCAFVGYVIYISVYM